MFLNFNQVYVNFDHLLDTEKLVNLRPRISAFMAKHSNLINPSRYFQDNFYDRTYNKGILNHEEEIDSIIDNTQDPELKQAITEVVKKDKFGYYSMYELDAAGGNFSLVLRYSTKTYYDKHLSENCASVDADKEFDFFYQWLDAQNIFKDYGRVTVFVNHPGTTTTLHKDWPYVDTRNDDQFIWINLFGDRKKFYLFDDQTKEKIYINGVCNWFNTGNWHGTDPVEKACYTIRVDGLFADEFLAKIEK